MKKIFNKIMVFGLALTMGLSSCGEDYLNIEPTGDTSAESAIGSTANAMKALNGVAKCMTKQVSFMGQGFAGENAIITMYENYPSQDFYFNAFAAGWADIHNMRLLAKGNGYYTGYPWYYYYTIIGQANKIIVNIDNATGPTNEKKYLKAAALTFRAYGYEKLLHYYCPRWKDSNNGAADGVVIRLGEMENNKARSSMAETYDQIYKDLDEAIELFESTDFTRHESKIWLPNINVAHAVYARAALTKEDYQTALDESRLAQNGFKLMSNDDYLKGFSRPTSEWIFGSFGGSDEQNWYWSFGTQFACNGYYASNTKFGCGQIGLGLYNQIPEGDVRKKLFITPEKFPEVDFKVDTDNVILNTGLIKDPKISRIVREYIAANAAEGFQPAPYAAGVYYLCGHMKFYVFDQPGVSFLPVIRTSEMVLTEAEAAYFLGKTDEAHKALVHLNKDSGRNPEYSCEKTGDELFEEIVAYRGIELWGEGFQWSDFKRWKRPIVRKSYAEGGSAAPAICGTIAPDECNEWTWAIPQSETDYNDGLNKANVSK